MIFLILNALFLIGILYKLLDLLVKSVKNDVKYESTACLSLMFEFSILLFVLTCVLFFIDGMIMDFNSMSNMIKLFDRYFDNRFLSLILYIFFVPAFLDEQYGSDFKSPESWVIIVHYLYIFIVIERIVKYDLEYIDDVITDYKNNENQKNKLE